MMQQQKKQEKKKLLGFQVCADFPIVIHDFFLLIICRDDTTVTFLTEKETLYTVSMVQHIF